MKRSLIALLALAFATPLFAGASVFGQTSPDQMNTTTQQTTSTEAVETPAQKTEREARVKQLKTAQKTKLTTTEKKKIQDKCQAAQGKMSSVTGKFNGIETSRAQVHKNILERLVTANNKLKEKGVATTQLEAEITALTAKIDTFNADLAAYKQAVTDLKAVDCKTDPEGFKAALTDARADLEKVRTSAKAVQTYLKETVRPLLTELKKQVSTTEGTSTPTGTGTQLNATDAGGQ